MLALAALSFFGCCCVAGCRPRSPVVTTNGEDGENVTIRTPAGTIETKEDGNHVEIQTPDGRIEGGTGTEVPKDFPFAIPPGAEVTAVMELPTGTSVLLKSSETTEKLIEFYEKDVVEKGYTINNRAIVDRGGKQSGSLLLGKGEDDKAAATILFGQDGDDSVVTFTLPKVLKE